MHFTYAENVSVTVALKTQIFINVMFSYND